MLFNIVNSNFKISCVVKMPSISRLCSLLIYFNIYKSASLILLIHDYDSRNNSIIRTNRRFAKKYIRFTQQMFATCGIRNPSSLFSASQSIAPTSRLSHGESSQSSQRAKKKVTSSRASLHPETAMLKHSFKKVSRTRKSSQWVDIYRPS